MQANPPLETQLHALWEEALREDFGSFLHQSVNTLNPGAKFLPNWHLGAMGEYLAAVERGQLTRLIINMPPRYLKSLTVSVAWPAWLLGRNPTKRVIVASYAAGLSLKHSLDCRSLLAAPWYQKIYPKTQLLSGQNEKHKYMTTDYGFRLATSVGGTLTGEGGDVLIVDDPLNPSQADSSLFRNLANRWFENTFSSRLNDKRHGGMVVVMQRLHPQDMSGYLLEKGNWELLELAAIATRTQHFIGCQFDYRRPEGECLHQAREDAQMLARVKHEMGSYAFAAQYQQQPLVVTGGMVKGEWIGRYVSGEWRVASGEYSEEDSQPSEARREAAGGSEAMGGVSPPTAIIQSWDTAIKTGAGNDPSVCITFAQGEGKHYVLDVLREKLEYPINTITGMSRVLHLKSFHPLNDYYGLSPFEAAAFSVDMHNQANGWNQALLQNSARPSGALMVKQESNGGTLSEDQYHRIKQQMDEQFSGGANAGRPLLLEGGLEWKEMSLSPREMDYIGAKHSAARDIALAFGVPPQLLGIPGDNTYSNLAEARLALWEQTVIQLLQMVRDGLNGWLTYYYSGGILPLASLSPTASPPRGRSEGSEELLLEIDTNNVSALTLRQEKLWARLEKASFLTEAEKRELAGVGAQ